MYKLDTGLMLRKHSRRSYAPSFTDLKTDQNVKVKAELWTVSQTVEHKANNPSIKNGWTFYLVPDV
jgi:hypothetical protein